MTSRRRFDALVVALLAVLAMMLGVVVGVAPAGATESPPVFVAKWGSQGTLDGQFSYTKGLARNPTTGDLYVVDTGNHRVQQFTSAGVFVRKWGSQGSGDGQFFSPYGIAVNPTSGDVYVADVGNARVQQFTSAGVFVRAWGENGSGAGQFHNAYGIAVSPTSGDVYVTDADNTRVEQFTSTGTFVRAWGTSGTGDGQFTWPYMVAVSPVSGDVYVGDALRHRLQEFTSTGTFVRKWGSSGLGDGQFNGGPEGVTVDGDGNVYVTEFSRVQKFTSAGVFLTKWGTSGSGNGQFNSAEGVVVTADDHVYVLDSSNYRVQEFAPSTDTTDPTVDLRTPANGAVYARSQVVLADFSCADEVGGSGIATCVGTVPDGSPVNTATYGSHSFTATATDNAGNTAFDTNTYTVATPRPDALVKKGTGAFVGNGVYNATGLNQTVSGSAARGSSVTYTLKVQNDSLAADVLRLKGPGSSTTFGVTYTVGGTDVTTAMVAGTYDTPTLAPGATLSVKVVVKVKSSAPAGSSLTALLTAKSRTDSTYKDTVKVVTRRA